MTRKVMTMIRYMSISLSWSADDCKTGKAFCKMIMCKTPFYVLQMGGCVRLI